MMYALEQFLVHAGMLAVGTSLHAARQALKRSEQVARAAIAGSAASLTRVGEAYAVIALALRRAKRYDSHLKT